MTSEGLITAKEGITLEEAKRVLAKARKEKLPIVDDEGNLTGLITIKDIEKQIKYPLSAKDSQGRLLCGAAIGITANCLERVDALVKAKVDVIVMDSAHGHSANVLRTVRMVKEKYPDLQVIAGNVATGEAAKALIEAGVDAVKVGIGPGSICTTRVVAGIGVPQVTAVMDCYNAAKEYGVPIRVGVNSGSLEKPLIEKYGGVTAEGIVESALDKVHMIEEMGYDNLVVSIKSSDVLMCVKAHELIAEQCPYPLHVGITESGTVYSGNVKSSVGLGIILYEGIGNTIRVSLTGDPVEEIRTAKLILKTLGLRKGGIEVVSCPTCGRTRINLIHLANEVEKMVADIPLDDIKVAVMGCVVNGPGEAKEADIGIAGGIGEGLLIKKGQVIKKVKEEELLDTLRQELLNWNR